MAERTGMDRLNGGDIRQGNFRAILSVLRQQGPMTKTDLAGRLGLTRQAVNIIVGEMLAGGYLRDGGRKTGGVGRSSTFYALDPGAAFGIGLVSGASATEAILVDFLGAVHYRAQAPTRSGPEAKRAVIDSLAAAIAGHCRDAGIARDRIAGVGLLTDRPDAQLAALAGSSFALPVATESRAAAAAMAEFLKSEGTLPEAFAFVSLGETLDAALVQGGTLHRGLRGGAMRLADLPSGDTDRLGDCSSLAALSDRLSRQGVDAGDLYAAEIARPDTVAAWLAEAGTALGGALASLHLLLDLGAVVIDAALPNSHAHRLLETTAQALARRLPADCPPPQLLRSRLGRDAAALGAAMLPLQARFAEEAGERTPGTLALEA